VSEPIIGLDTSV